MKIDPSKSLSEAAVELVHNSLNERLSKEEFAEMLEHAWTSTTYDLTRNEPTLYHGWVIRKEF